MPFVASQEENRLFINCIIASFTKHILRTRAMSDTPIVLRFHRPSRQSILPIPEEAHGVIQVNRLFQR